MFSCWLLFRSWQEVALLSKPSIERAREHLPSFPAAEHLPKPLARTPAGRFVYAPGAWEDAARAPVAITTGVKRKCDPTMWKELRREYCTIWSLKMTEVAPLTVKFFREHGRWQVYAADAGAGGDCFFLSVASILMQARAAHPELRPALESVEPHSWEERVSVGAGLRKVVGRHVRHWGVKQFLDFVVTCVSAEAAEAWKDDWSMRGLLRKSDLTFLLHVNELLDVDVLDDAIVLRFKEGDSTVVRNKRLRHGAALVEALQEAVAKQFEQMGNNHWATENDVAAVAQELNLGFILAGNTSTGRIGVGGKVWYVCLSMRSLCDVVRAASRLCFHLFGHTLLVGTCIVSRRCVFGHDFWRDIGFLKVFRCRYKSLAETCFPKRMGR